MIFKKHIFSFIILISILFFSAIVEAQQKGYLVIFSGTKDAKIYIDGEFIGVIPYPEPVELSAGEHTVRLTKEGYAEYYDTFQIVEGETTELEIDLIGFAGILRISSNVQDAIVQLDNKVVGKTPIEIEASAGDHIILMKKEGYKEIMKNINVKAGEKYDLMLELEKIPEEVLKAMFPEEKKPFYKKSWFWIVGGVLAGGVAVTVIVLSRGEKVKYAIPSSEIDLIKFKH